MIEVLVTILHILTCAVLILVVLLQSGKGGGVSAAFGGGAGVALGQRAAATVLSKFTGVAAAIFMVTSMLLAWFSSPDMKDPTKNVVDDVIDTPAPMPAAAEIAPAIPAPVEAAPAAEPEKVEAEAAPAADPEKVEAPAAQ